MSDAAIIQVVELVIGPFVAVGVSYLVANLQARVAVAKAHQAAQDAREALGLAAENAARVAELKALHDQNAGRLDAHDRDRAAAGPLVVVAVEGGEVDVAGVPAGEGDGHG